MDSFLFSIIVGVLILSIGGWVNYRIRNNSLRYKAETRGEISRDFFVKYFEKKGFAKRDIDILYDEILTYVPHKGFSMHPKDNLVDEYEINDEDLMEIAEKIYEDKFNKRATKKQSIIAEVAGASIQTFEGVLIFVSKDWSD